MYTVQDLTTEQKKYATECLLKPSNLFIRILNFGAEILFHICRHCGVYLLHRILCPAARGEEA